MTDIGFNDNIAVNERKFHVQTASNLRKGTVRCEVFEQGRLITTEQIQFERRREDSDKSKSNRIQHTVQRLHEDTINEIELLFNIADKVKKLRHAPSNIKLGRIFFHYNLMKDAIEHFETALSISPESVEALNNLGLVHLAMDNAKKAIKIFNQALEKNSHFPDLHLNLGRAHLQSRLHYRALQNFQEALRINPEYDEARYYMMMLYLESIRYDPSEAFLPPPSIRKDRAIQQLQKLESNIDAVKKIAPNIREHIQSSNLEKALDILESQQKKIFPPEITSLIGMDFYLKFMYGGQGLENGIISKFEMRLQNALQDHPQYADLWNNLGIVHLIQCRNLFLQALNEFDRALEINPSFDKAQKNKKLVENDGKEFLILLRAILK